MDGQILSLILALSKKQALKYGNIGIININANTTNDGITFELVNGTKHEIKLNNLNFMKLSQYDKNNDGIIDLAEVARTSNMSKDSKKLNGKDSSLYFQKDINTTDDITEGTNNRFFKQSDKDKINNISAQINANQNNINQLKSDLNNKKDELVKLNSSDTADYLENKIDNNSVQIKNNKLIAKSLDGLEVTIAELNMLKGIKDNIQKMMDLTQKGMQFRGFVNTYEELLQTSDAKAGYTSIVRADENSESRQMFYIYDGSNWQPTYEVSSRNMGRDFTTEPLDLMVETKGVLPENQIDENIARRIDIKNKLDKVPSATQDNIAILNSDGTIKDSNNKLSDYAKTNHTHQELEDRMALKEDLHSHTNKDVIDKLSTNVEGKLLFDNKLIEGNQQVIEYDSFTNFPPIGEENKIYITKDKNIQYRWDTISSTFIPYNSEKNNSVNSITNARNIGTGEKVFKVKTDDKLEFKTLKSGSNINIIDTPNELIIESSLSNERAKNILFENKDDYDVTNNIISFNNGVKFQIEKDNPSALLLNGTNYADVNMPSWGNTYTLECKIKPSTNVQNVWAGILFRGNSSTAEGLFIDSTRLFFRNGTTYSPVIEQFNNENYPINEFTHISIVQSGNKITYYRIKENGTFVKVTEFPFTPRNSDGKLSIGRFGEYVANDSQFKGIIDDIRIWNKPLSEEEIKNKYQTKLTGNEENLIAYWNCDEKSGDVLHDSSPNKYDATFNSPQWTADSPLLGFYKTGKTIIKTKQPYTNIDLNLTKIIGEITINEKKYIGSTAKYMVSFDGGSTWKYYNNKFNNADINDIFIIGNTREEIILALKRYVVNTDTDTKLLFAIGLKNDSTSESPILNSISVKYTLGTNEQGKIGSKYVNEDNLIDNSVPVYNLNTKMFEFKKYNISEDNVGVSSWNSFEL